MYATAADLPNELLPIILSYVGTDARGWDDDWEVSVEIRRGARWSAWSGPIGVVAAFSDGL